MTNNFLKSIGNTLTALDNIEKKSKKNLKRKSLLAEFMNYNPNENNVQEENKNQNEEEEKPQIKLGKNFLENEIFDQEISVSSINYSAGSDAEDFAKIKQVILPKTKKKEKRRT